MHMTSVRMRASSPVVVLLSGLCIDVYYLGWLAASNV